LYGTTEFGGGYSGVSSPYGTVFKVAPSGSEAVIYSFAGGDDGWYPVSGLVRDQQGNLYGTTAAGGVLACFEGFGGEGCGTVFEIAANGQETVLYRFTGTSDGAEPLAGLVRDSQGNLYGTTNGGNGGAATVFSVDSAGQETVLYEFAGVPGAPDAGLLRDAQGDLYGTTAPGSIFKLSAAGKGALLYSFPPPALIESGLIEDSQGNLYGANGEGGTYGYGAVFKLTILTATTTTLTSSPNPSTHGQAVTFTAVVNSSKGAPPNGESVSFMQGTTVLGTGTLSSGTAVFMTSTLAVGTHSITAVYSGDSTFAASTSKPVKQVVNKATGGSGL
jgi:uncharacterized repeat protein (TIGR03803 family)